MEKKNLCVAFSTQKGGAGKTTLTVLVASYLHYEKGLRCSSGGLRLSAVQPGTYERKGHAYSRAKRILQATAEITV